VAGENEGQRREDCSALDDADLLRLARARCEPAVRELTRRYNQRLFRIAWSILGSRFDAEEVVQDAYVKAFTSPADFAGDSSFSTWLTRIAIREALERRRKTQRRAHLLEKEGVAWMDDYRVRVADAPVSLSSPEQTAARKELARRLESAVAQLAEPFRTVFLLRDVEGMNAEDAAAALCVPPQTVKTRLLRARRRLQSILAPDLRAALQDTFPFCGARCAALTERVAAQYLRQQRGELT
jgi:RNA polymerase sigma-70 factor (ECF subfamily)